MKLFEKVFSNIFKTIPLDYQKGFQDGFSSGIKFYKESIDSLDKFMNKSTKRDFKEKYEYAKALQKQGKKLKQ